MGKITTFATKLPVSLTEVLDQVCGRLGLKKSFVVESALREKLEDLLDAADLESARQDATGFHSWESVKKDLARDR